MRKANERGKEHATLELWRRDIGLRIFSARQAANLSQQTLAEPGYTRAHVSRVEQGKVFPSVKALIYFADKLGVDLCNLLCSASATKEHGKLGRN